MKKAFLFIVTVLFASNVHGEWQVNGPFTGNISSLAINGSDIFAGTNNGVFLSKDNGANWVPVNNGLPANNTVTSIVFSGSNILIGTTYFDGTSSFGNSQQGVGSIFVSTNNGTSWSVSNNGLPSDDVLCLTVSGSNIFASTGGGVFLSTDNGSNWSPANNGLSLQPFTLAAIGSTIFAGTNNGVFLSNDNGANWSLEDSSFDYTVTSLAVMGSNLIAGVGSAGVYISGNNGSTWTPAKSGFPNFSNVYTVYVSGSELYAGTSTGIYLSTDTGGHWTSIGLANTNVTAIATIDSIIFAGATDMEGSGGGGVFLSVNAGNDWSVANNGILDADITTLASGNSGIYAGTYGRGVFLSTDSGSTWNSIGLTNYNIVALAVKGSDIFAGTNGPGAGLYLSTNNGNNWTEIDNGITGLISSIVTVGQNIYAGTISSGVFVSDNIGSSWTAINNGLTNTTVITLCVSGSKLYAGTSQGIYVSIDSGSTWSNITGNLYYSYITAIAVNDSFILAGTAGDGVYISSDTGITWTTPNLDFSDDVSSFAVNGSHIYAGAVHKGVFLSDDYGNSWTQIDSGLTSTYAYALLISGTDIYVGISGVGVFQQSLNDTITITPMAIGKIQATSSPDFKLFPNPANSSFVITTNTGGQKLMQVFDITGRLMLAQTIQTGNTPIDASNLASGVYVVSLKSEEGVATDKLVISK